MDILGRIGCDAGRAASCLLLLAIFAGCTAQEIYEPDRSKQEAGVEGAGDPRQSPYVYEPDFRRLLLEDFEFFSASPDEAKETWRQSGNIIHCSGTPRGYIYTKEAYDDFNLRGEYRLIPSPKTKPEKHPNANTGILCFITGEHRLWPMSLEVQGKWSEMGMIRPNGGAGAVELQDEPETREKVRKPVGEWNQLEIMGWDGQLAVLLNGVRVCQSAPGELKSGPIGIQAEDWEFEFRNLRIQRKPKQFE